MVDRCLKRLGRCRNQFRGIWGTSGTNVYLTGQQGLILRFDGKTWKTVTLGMTGTLYSFEDMGDERDGHLCCGRNRRWRRRRCPPQPGGAIQLAVDGVYQIPYWSLEQWPN